MPLSFRESNPLKKTVQVTDVVGSPRFSGALLQRIVLIDPCLVRGVKGKSEPLRIDFDTHYVHFRRTKMNIYICIKFWFLILESYNHSNKGSDYQIINWLNDYSVENKSRIWFLNLFTSNILSIKPNRLIAYYKVIEFLSCKSLALVKFISCILNSLLKNYYPP